MLRYPFLVLLIILMGFSGAVFNGVSTILIVPIVLELLGQSANLVSQLPSSLQKFLGLFDGLPDRYRLLAMSLSVVGLIVLKKCRNLLRVAIFQSAQS